MLQELQRRRGGASPEPGLEIQRVTVQMANTLSALRQLARFTDDGGVVVDPARVPCVSSQRHCGVPPEHDHQQPCTIDISSDDPYMESAASCTSNEIRNKHEELKNPWKEPKRKCTVKKSMKIYTRSRQLKTRPQRVGFPPRSQREPRFCAFVH